jgi:hypothetical protein
LFYYKTHGLTISSEIKLSGYFEIQNSPAQVNISIGNVPSRLIQPAINKNAIFSVSNGELMLDVPKIVKYYATSNNVCIEPAEGATEKDIVVFLIGSVMGTLLHFNNILPMHASTINIGNKAVMIAGDSGSGKSSVSAYLAMKNAQLLSDDLSSVHFQNNLPITYSGNQRIKIWDDTREYLKLSNKLERIRSLVEKYYFSPNLISDELFSVSHLFILSTHNKYDIQIDNISGVHKLNKALKNVYRYRLVRNTTLESGIFNKVSKLVNNIEVYEIKRPFGLKHLPEIGKYIKSIVSNG